MGTTQKKMVTFLVTINVALAVMATTVVAEELENHYGENSVQVKLGLFEPTGEANDVGYDAGGEINLAFNRYLSERLVLEGAFSFFATKKDSEGFNDNAGSYHKNNYLGVAALLLTIKREFPVGPVDLFGGAGVGVYNASLNSEIDKDNGESFDLDDNDSVFGVHLVAGVNYNFNEHFFLGLEGSYRWTDDLELSESDALVPVHFEGDLSGVTVSMAAGFRF